MKIPKEYIEDLLINLAYNSSAIEGNTITLAETSIILGEKELPTNFNKSLRELNEIQNHRKSLENILQHVEKKELLNIDIIKSIHKDLTENILYNAGEFKTDINYIRGATLPTSHPKDVYLNMKQWIDNNNYRLENATTKDEKISILAESHIKFEQIHPFTDGNGRTGRMIMNYSLLLEDIAPIIIPSTKRVEYIESLQNNGKQALFKLIKPLIEQEEIRLQTFKNNEQFYK